MWRARSLSPSLSHSLSCSGEQLRERGVADRPIVTLGMRQVPRPVPSGMMHCHVRHKVAEQVAEAEGEAEEQADASPNAAGSEQQAAGNKEIKWRWQRTQQLQECLHSLPSRPAALRYLLPLLLLSLSPSLSLCLPQRAAAGEAQRIAAFAFTMLN